MAGDGSGKNVVSLMISMGLFIIILFLFVVFLGYNYWWILPAFFYLAYFVYRDYSISRKEFLKGLKVKDCKEIRINFWN
jgi:4-hydroxybenzoate polyprenyltransferase